MTDRRWAPGAPLAIAMAVGAAINLSIALVLFAVSGPRAADVASIRFGEAVALAIPWLVFAIVGAIVVKHRPDNTVGWLCSLAGLIGSLVALPAGIATFGLAADPPAPFGVPAAWFTHVASISIVAAPLVILFRFPTGRPLGPWWLRVERLAVVAISGLLIAAAVEPMLLLSFPTTPNPVGLGDGRRIGVVTFVPVLVCAAAAVASQVVRFRHGSPLERRQVRLLGIAAGFLGLALTTMPITSPDLVDGGDLTTLTALINALALASIPMAIGFAIVRDRLYDIDRVVNRTLVYALVSAVLAAVYVIAVLALSAVVGVVAPDVRGTVPTAIATLLVAASFRPVRGRAQVTIDRRFDRERYEAGRIIDAFGGRIRGDLELDAIVDDLREAVSTTVRPSMSSCWVRDRGTG